MSRAARWLVLVVALLAFGAAYAASGASAATGVGNATMAMGSVSIDVAHGTSFSVAAQPSVFAPGQTQQSVWDSEYQSAQGQFPGQTLDVYTVACWQVRVDAPVTPTSGWKCGGPFVSGEATSLDSTLAQSAVGSLATSGRQMCSWLEPYDVTNNDCLAAPGTQYEDGVGSPVLAGDMVPNLDSFVGQTVTFNVLTNWCSYLAPAGFDLLHNIGYDDSGMATDLLGCANQEYGVPVGLASTNGSVRTLAATGPQLAAKVKVQVKASPFDCHVPRVKGLTLRKARARLLAAHCRVGHVTRVKRGKSGRVRYQPLKVGAGRPRGYRVSLAVTR